MSSTTGYGRLILVLPLILLALALVACGDGTPVDATAVAETTVPEPPPSATAEPAETQADPTPEAIESTPEPSETMPPAEPSATTEAQTAEPTATPTVVVTPEFQVSQISLAPVAGGFARPLYLTHAFDERLFVVEQVGRVMLLVPGQAAPEAAPFLDIIDRVGSASLEQGLLSIAFHPGYQENGRFFVNYTDLSGNTVVAEYRADPDDPNAADRDSEQILLVINQPFGNHNGGLLKFGPDGYLYVGMGDGGSAGDPQNQGQNAGTLLGAILRLDVDNPDPDGQLPYGIPADNPFVGADGARGEIWAYGVRNPWRFSFDRQTGDMYMADVGQNLWEEVNFQAADSPGGENYGWNVMEASTCFGANSCDQAGLVLPVTEYRHEEGHCSITGGYVYRGEQFPALSGNYFYADYCSGAIWSLFRDAAAGWQARQLQRTGMRFSSFGEDWGGELYIIDQINGDIYQIQP